MIKEIEVFGQKINIRNYLCNSKQNEIVEGKYYFNLYIKITDYCNAKCKFCSNQSSKPCREELDLVKLEKVLKELKEKNLINRISITGGEPFLYIDRLNTILNKVFEVIPNAFVTINTNGINFDKIYQIETLDKLEGIHISRHHYDDQINNQIFGVKTATFKELKELYEKSKNKRLIRLNCLLIKGLIDNIDEITKYLDFASEVGVFRVGFVSLMQTNDYCKEHFINYNDIFQNINEKHYNARRLYDSNICECYNGIYLTKNSNLIQYYARMTKELNCDYTRQFVYTTNNELSIGFGKKKIEIK